MTDWDELSPLEIDNQRLRADCAKLETAHRQNMREIDTLRAELAAQADVHTQIQMQLSDERDALRAALIEWLDWWELPRGAKRPDVAELIYNRACDALKGDDRD